MRNTHLYIAIVCLFFCLASAAQKPTANFKSNITGGCSPIVVDFQDQSTGNPTSWLWDFGNGATSTLRNPSATYFSPGTYTVKLTATNAAGSDSVTKSAYITVIDPPNVSFVADKVSACAPNTVAFTDQSTAAGGTANTTWEWDFGDGTTSNQQSPSKLYSTPDNYTITLKITNDKGCSKVFTRPNYVNIAEGVTSDFSNNQPTLCNVPVSVNFTNLSTGPGNLSYLWDFGDGTTSTEANPTHSYATNGKYTVTLTTNSNLGCGNTIKKTDAVVVGGYTTNFDATKVCEAAETKLMNASTPQPLSSLWVFPDGTTSTEINPTKVFAASGPVSIKLVNNYGTCSDSVTKTLTVAAKPALAFETIDTVKCQAPFVVNFTNTTNAATYQWNFGDGGTSTQASPSHTYSQLGNYTVGLVATTAEGCVDSLKKTDLIKIQKPVISFPGFPQMGCLPYATTFTPKIDLLDTVLTYQWNFGDGGTSSDPNPSHTYTQRGTYDVTLTITTSTGCTETFVLKAAIKVGPKPVAAFTVDQTDICASSMVKFTDQSTPADQIDEWTWTFGDGSTSTLQNPSVQFLDTGLISVQLVAFNSGCPSDQLVKSNLIRVRPPIAQFTFRPDCNKRNDITFTNTTIYDPSLPTTWEWNFGDGGTSTQQNPGTHTFPSPIGKWDVSLKVTNGPCSYTYRTTITLVDQTPDFNASAVTGCKPFTTTFQATAAVNIVSSVWEFGDGTTESVTGGSIGHTYSQSGNYNIRVTTIDQYGCQDSRGKSQFIKVYGPIANFASTNNSGCLGTTVSFQDQSTTDGQHPIASWQWIFGDNKTQTFTAAPFQHKYDTAGSFNVVLAVKDSYGCVDSIRQNNLVTISGLKANWDANKQTCPGAVFQFTNSTAGTFNSVWEFGDGNTSTEKSPFHSYADTGFYTIKLRVEDAIGCQDSLLRTSYIQVGKPVASFTENNLTSFCTPFQAKFTNTSTYFTDKFWDLSIATSRRDNPSLYYTQTGIYDISLTVTSPGGCKDVVTKKLKVYNPNDGTITYGPDLSGCKPITISLQAFEEMNARFIWDMGDGNVIDTSSNKISHTYKDPGNFTPRIILQEPSGNCTVALTGKEVVQVYGANVKFGINQRLFCDSGYLRISDSTIYNGQSVVYNWNFGDGTTSSNPTDTVHFYSSPGNYDVFLTVTTNNECVDTLRSAPIKVVQSPLVSIQSDSVICANVHMRHAGVFDRPDTSAVRWAWQFPNGNTASVQYPANQLYNKAGNYIVEAIATNSSGCADTAYQSVRVDSIPIITMPSTITMQQSFPVTIPATYSANVTNYSWFPSNTLSCADCPQPVAGPKFNTKYTVSVVDSNNCKNSADIQVVVICKDANVFVPNTFSPNGDGSNDIFYVRGRGLDRVKSLRIFNRWGEIVFEKRDFAVNDASVGWNGTHKGNRPQPDVYIYQVEVFCDNSEVIRFEGNVALIQ